MTGDTREGRDVREYTWRMREMVDETRREIRGKMDEEVEGLRSWEAARRRGPRG